MRLTVTTWNINSVRLRIDLVAKFIKAVRPDVLCLQETKCPDDAFPLKRFRRLGYEHVALNGQKGYHGVAVLSRLPFETFDMREFLRQDRLPPCRGDARREGRPARSGHGAQFLCAGRRRRAGSRRSIRSSPTSSRSSTRCATATTLRPAADERAILVGDLNVAPLEHDVWSHKQMLRVVSHTPIECEKLTAVQKAGNWVDADARARAGAGEALHVVELSRARLGGRRQAAAGSITSGSRRRWATASRGIKIAQATRAAGRGRPTTCR